MSTFLNEVRMEGAVVPQDEPQDAPEEQVPADSLSENEVQQPPAPEGGQNEVVETPEESLSEEVETTEESDNTPEEDKQLPFHKHPRWKAKMQELDEERQARKQLEERNASMLEQMQTLADTVERLGQAPKLEQPEQIPQWFVNMVGYEDHAAWNEFKAYTGSQKERESLSPEDVAKQAAEMLQAQQQQQEQELQQWNKWVDEEIATLSKATGTDFDDPSNESHRNGILKVALEYQPMAEDGNISIAKAYEIYSALQAREAAAKPDTMQERKKLASQTVPSPAAEVEPKEFKTHQDLRSKSFQSLARE